MADVGLAQDGAVLPPAAQAADFLIEGRLVGTDEVHRYFSRVRAAVVELISPI